MANITARLVEVFQLGSEIAGIVDLPPKYWPAPGQYLPCQSLSEDSEVLISHLFKVIGTNNGLSVGPLPARWQPGDLLTFQPPQGQGYEVPETARRIGLLAFRVSPARLLTLVKAAIAQNGDVSLFCEPTPPKDILNHLPTMIEVGSSSSLLENLDWPDYLAIDLTLRELDQLSTFIGDRASHLKGQVLVRTAMPCRGLGECGACSIKINKGWRLTCVDGPVFSLKEVLGVAR